MMSALFKRTKAWVPVALVLAVVLLGGARLIVLSLQQHAATARDTVAALATQLAASIEGQLQGLAGLAARQAARVDTNGDGAALTTAQPVRNGFFVSAAGAALPSKGTAATMASSIVSEWASASGSLQRPSVLGPMREGSQWIVAARVPLVVADASEDTPTRGWSVVYEDLDKLLAAAHLGQLVNAGYDFAIVQAEPRSEDSRGFVSSSAAPLATPMVRSIHLPAGFSPAIAGSDLRVAIRPRGGWYPASELATEIGLLAVIAWLLAFGTQDLIHSLHRLQERLAVSRQRQHTLSARLSTEIEQRQDLQKSFDHARYHDAFTGLPNRRYFINQLDRALREVRTRRRQRVGVILVDVTRFRLINDTLGHTAGDELMVQAARRFTNATAAFDCVLARWGGDQFAVLLLDVPAPESTMALARVLQDALQEPFELRRHRLSITASMGLTCADSTPQRAEDVIREADIALSAAKKDETTRTIAYVATMGGHAASLVSLEADLHLALANNELQLLFQPIVDLRNYRMVGAEVLLRWRHPIEGVLTPDKFLAIAEEVGLMVPITRRIIQRACKLAALWRQRLPQGPEFYLSINLSAAVLRDQGLAEYVATILQETKIPTSALKFEVTEAGLINNVGAAREVLERLHRLGVQLILDDFGTGYSSLNYLQLFPLDYIKIDRPFVNRAGTDRANTGMMAAIVQMAPSLGLTTIAEIIETEAVAQALRQMGCEFGQGYFFSKPVEAEIALRFLLEQPFLELLPSGEARTAAATAADVQPSAVEDDSPTLILPPISAAATGMQDEEEGAPERGKRPQRTG
jgi:diguanylate cyclase (GGDEF)-like protein